MKERTWTLPSGLRVIVHTDGAVSMQFPGADMAVLVAASVDAAEDLLSVLTVEVPRMRARRGA